MVEGSYAIAEAVKQCKPKVISAYPITPQTHIVEYLAEMVSNGELYAKYIWAESEFSAASIALGASATGVRSYTASSSQGLLLMAEVLWNLAGMRLPIVITAANRAVSAPITIEVDHQDTMTFRDTGIIQVYVEEPQEAYETHFLAYKVSEDKKVLLPATVCVDGWTLTHAYEPVTFYDQEIIDDFLPDYDLPYRLTPDYPLVLGSWGDESVLMESKYEMYEAQEVSKKIFEEYSLELSEITGHYYGGAIEEYHTDNAEICFIAMGSICGTVREVVDEMKSEGNNIGLIKIRLYRPFPKEEVIQIIRKQNIEKIIILDRSLSIGSGSCLGLDLKSHLYDLKDRPTILNCFAGIGGKMITHTNLKKLVGMARDLKDNSYYWLDLHK